MSAPESIGTQVLRAARIDLDPGLTDREVESAQDRYGFTFVPEHREFLQHRLPVGHGWPDWRGMPPAVRERLDWPVEGVLFDVAHGFWHRSWGPRPESAAEAADAARAHLADVPKLVPVYSHRYVPAAPVHGRPPVFSVHQTDVIHYGANLDDYLEHEFLGTLDPLLVPDTRIRFWDDLVERPDEHWPRSSH